ncbi:Core-2/I-branching beta-1-6-N-acetylglucosaminyltransferase family protein [Striga hermonthica]|uniref:Core-2/I-branching beta-1-6-N-acetylglucosaminyltransferase family protein n=1 Tax=Striga hermonthica TaxID=68872 RepID=A0A9N7NWM6_STRHE|nr:Core-2/I-branching beta-1-6-N-acetylglucosaminyltransferase family protein [Striga hermonthica]
MKKARLFHLFFLVVGISIGIFSTLCLKSFSFSIPSLLLISPISLSISDNPSVIPLSSTNETFNDRTNVSTEDNLRAPPPPLIILSSPNETSNYTNNITSPTNFSIGNDSTQSMSEDEELFTRASRVQGSTGKESKAKVAFLFLARGPLPLAPFWDGFFKGHDGLFSVYVHSHPSYNDSSSPVPKGSAFYRKRIPSKPVDRGSISMVDAERRLLANALLDSSNQRFVLVSESCIPVFNFTTVYDYLMGANGSFLGTIEDPWKRSKWRYDRRMLPTVNVNQWRKGSQWFSIRRDIAGIVVSDKEFYRAFHDFCPALPCFSDEHYLQTLVNVLCPELNTKRAVTWCDWSLGGGHPRTFGRLDVNVELLERIRFGSECVYNGNVTNVCNLFARKFAPTALGPLLEIGPSALGFDL